MFFPIRISVFYYFLSLSWCHLKKLRHRAQRAVEYLEFMYGGYTSENEYELAQEYQTPGAVENLDFKFYQEIFEQNQSRLSMPRERLSEAWKTSSGGCRHLNIEIYLLYIFEYFTCQSVVEWFAFVFFFHNVIEE